MSSVPMTEKRPDSDFRARVRKEIEEHEAKLRLLRRLEADWADLEKSLPAKGLEGRFLNKSKLEAIQDLLTIEDCPMPRPNIISALIEGGVRLGRFKEKSINQSISTNVGLGNLKEANGLIGLKQWPDEKFQE